MALNKADLKADILELLTDMRTRTEVSDEEYADRLATTFDNYVKEATINYNYGLIAPNGNVTGQFVGNLE